MVTGSLISVTIHTHNIITLPSIFRVPLFCESKNLRKKKISQIEFCQKMVMAQKMLCLFPGFFCVTHK